MSSKELLAAALALPLDERADLARELIASLDGPPDVDADAAWGEEIERRIADWRAGRTKGVPWPEAEARILARLERVRTAR
jgi:putative addiction module component (TIGR02574 family)